MDHEIEHYPYRAENGDVVTPTLGELVVAEGLESESQEANGVPTS